MILDVYLDGFKLTPLQALLHDSLSVKKITDRKAKVGFRVDCLGDMGGFHGEEWSHMTDLYPQNIQNFEMGDAWEKAPVLFEACWHMNDWYLQGWEIDYIIQETLKWHITSFNNKGTVVPEPWKDKVKAWLNKMGYRFELRKFTYDSIVKASGELEIRALWANVGVAPIYNHYPLVIRLIGHDQSYTLHSREDIREWLPDEDIAWEERFALPGGLSEGEYRLEIGIETGVKEIGNIKLAIEGHTQGYYPMGITRWVSSSLNGGKKGMDRRLSFNECVAICNFDYLPEGLEAKYNLYHPNNNPHLIPREFLSELLEQYQIPELTRRWLIRWIETIEQDAALFHFTQFLVEELCSARNRCDEIHYSNMTPGCMNQDGELYSFLLLLACVVPSMEMLKKRSVPPSYYEQIPHQPLKHQLEKLVLHGDAKVHDFPWVMNFYTCSIFLLDRFYFIPYRFGDPFTMFRHVDTEEVIALRHAGEEFRSDGQRNGINDVYDPQGCFTSDWLENGEYIIANGVNPMGFVEREPTPILKKEWEPVLQEGDTLLALHIPSGPGYTPDRLKNSMSMAIEFYGKYFPELPIKGFWSASWLYDTRLSLILDNETSNIVRVQRQFYNYPTLDGDEMLRYEVFGNRNSDPVRSPGEFTTSLQKAAAAYMQTGARFNTLSMIVLKEEIGLIGSMPYINDADIEQFRRTVDSHLREVSG